MVLFIMTMAKNPTTNGNDPSSRDCSHEKLGLIHLFKVPAIGSQIASFLFYSDLECLSLCHHGLEDMEHLLPTSLLHWLKEVEVLDCMGTDTVDSDVKSKIMTSIRKHPDRSGVVCCCEAAGVMEPESGVVSLYHFAQHWGDTVGEEHWSFETASEGDLEDRGCEEGQMYQVVRRYDAATETNQSGGESRKRVRRLECCMGDDCCCCTKNKKNTESNENGGITIRLFTIKNRLYCGACVDASPFRRFRLIAANDMGFNGSQFGVKELLKDYDSNQRGSWPTQQEWGLKEDMFWTSFFSNCPYMSNEVRFLGVGPRDNQTPRQNSSVGRTTTLVRPTKSDSEESV